MSSNISALANLDGVDFKVLSVSSNLAPLGVDNGPPGSRIYINGPVDTWTVEIEGDKIRIVIEGYRYIGVDRFGLIFASNDPQDDVLWDVWPHQDKQAFSITQADKPYLAWTVLSYGQVAVQDLVVRPDVIDTQLFQYGEV